MTSAREDPVRAVAERPARPADDGASRGADQHDTERHGDTERYGDPNVLVDAHEDRWAWRARIKANPTTRRVYRTAVGVVGVAIVLLGIVALPAPGPGWAIIFVGLAVLASEFERAQRVLDFAKKHVHRWTTWIGQQHLVVRLLVGLAVLALVLGIFWAYFAVVGVPSWLPDVAEDPLLQFVPGLG